MKSWAAGAESAGGKAPAATVATRPSAGAQAASDVGPQLTMAWQPPEPGMEAGQEPQGGRVPEGDVGRPASWQSPCAIPLPVGTAWAISAPAMAACNCSACPITMR